MHFGDVEWSTERPTEPGYRNEWDTGLGTDPGMWEMLSECLEGTALPQSLSAAIVDLAEGRAFVVRREPGAGSRELPA